jgi:RNA polymerase sigma factor (sigma-70 family)
MAFLISEEQIRKTFNSRPKILSRFEELSPYLQSQVIKYYRNGGLHDGSVSLLKEKKIFMPGKNLSAVRAIFKLTEEEEVDVNVSDEEKELQASRRREAKSTAHSLSHSPVGDYSDLDDLAKHLQPRILAGDEEAWETLYTAFYPYVRALADLNLFYCHWLVDEVATDSLKEVWNKRAEWTPGTGLMTWLKYIVRGRCYNYENKEHTRHVLDKVPIASEREDDSGEEERGDSQIIPDTSLAPDKSVTRQEDVGNMMDEIHKMLESLPVEERQVMMMYAFEEKSVSEIAKSLGWKLSKVKSRLENARFYTSRWLETHPRMGRIMSFIKNESKGSKTALSIIPNIKWFVESPIKFSTSELSELSLEDDSITRINAILNS